MCIGKCVPEYTKWCTHTIPVVVLIFFYSNLIERWNLSNGDKNKSTNFLAKREKHKHTQNIFYVEDAPFACY